MIHQSALRVLGGSELRAIMDLPNLFTVNVAQAGQRVCVLILTNQSVLAGLLVVHASGSQMLAISEQVPYADDGALPVAIDQVLLELGDPAADVNEVVFCLEQNWFSDTGGLVPEKQTLLKKVKEDLSLQPVGYVLQHETITEYLINQQRQLSGVLLFLSGQSVTATLVTHGLVDATVIVGRSGEIQSDVVEALSRVAQQSGKTEMPGKILCSTIALEVAELFELQQELLTVVWPESVHFLQMPVVEVIKPQLSAQIVVTGAGKALQQLESGVPAEAGVAPAVAGETALESVAEPELEDVSAVPEPTDEEQDLEGADNVMPVAEPEYAIETAAPGVTFAHTTVTETALSPDVPAVATQPKRAQRGFFSQLLNKGHKATKRQLMLASLAAAVVAVLLVFFIGFIFLSQTATLELQIQPKTQQISQEVELTLDPTLTASDAQNKKIRAEKLDIELSASGETAATGIKIVGEKATGAVVLFNKSTAPKTFASGTVLKTGKLEYTLDEQVEVPAATVSAKPGGTGEEKEYGQRSAKASATIIGVDNNIAQDTALTVADFDSGTYSAKTETAMAGGSSREVRVVSQTDLDVLAADQKKELLKQAKEQLEAKQGDDQRVIPLDKLEVIKQTFSAKEGAEVDSVSLDISVRATGLAYYTTDLVPIAEAVLSGLVPSGYSLEGHTPQILSAGAPSGTSEVAVVVNLSSQVHALVETEQIKSALASQSLDQAVVILQGNPAIENARFVVKPAIARSLISSVPKNGDRFVIVVAVAE